MIATSYYQNPAIRKNRSEFYLVRVSLGHCRFCATDDSCDSLMPEAAMLGMEFAPYKKRFVALLRARKEAIRADLARFEKLAMGRTVLLLCFESLKQPEQWCHRRIFAEWWQSQTGHVIPEWSPQDRQLHLL